MVMMFTLSKFVFLVFLFGVLAITAYTYKEFQRVAIEGTATATAEKINSVARAMAASSDTSSSQEIILPSVLGTTTSFSSYILKISRNNCANPPCDENGAAAFCVFTTREAQKVGGQPLSCRAFTFNPLEVKLYDGQGNVLVGATDPNAVLLVRPETTQNLVLLKETKCVGTNCYPVLCITGCDKAARRGECVDRMKNGTQSASPCKS